MWSTWADGNFRVDVEDIEHIKFNDTTEDLETNQVTETDTTDTTEADDTDNDNTDADLSIGDIFNFPSNFLGDSDDQSEENTEGSSLSDISNIDNFTKDIQYLFTDKSFLEEIHKIVNDFKKTILNTPTPYKNRIKLQPFTFLSNNMDYFRILLYQKTIFLKYLCNMVAICKKIFF